MKQKQVYIAGFDVFCPDAQAVYRDIRLACQELNLVALIPADNRFEIGRDGSALEVAQKIRQANIAMLGQAQAVIANLAPFRGMEPDAGTVFEVGYAQALGLPVVGYGAGRASYAVRVGKTKPCVRDAQGRLYEKDSGMAVEDFGLPLNLMLASGMPLVRDARTALKQVAADFGGLAQPEEPCVTIPGWQANVAGAADAGRLQIRFR